MRSPAAPGVGLVTEELEPGLKGMRCPKTGGVWLRAEAYRRWRASDPGDAPADALPDAGEPGEDSPAGKRCPEDGYFLIRHAVGHGVSFHVERCGHCGGVWLDAGEWEALRAHGLGRSLHLVFTSAWQADVGRQQREALAEQRLTQWLGEADYAEAKRIRAWIDGHERSYELRAFLDGEYDA